jgi:vesicle coat complex subunit
MSSTRLKGEHYILNEELNSNDPVVKKDALKKVIVYMSVGKDVSPIFQSVIKCIELDDIEIKKLIYLYIINYSRSKPNDAIMIINQFCRVSPSRLSLMNRMWRIKKVR